MTRILIAAAAALLACCPVLAQETSTEERLCLADYVRYRDDAAKAMEALRSCAQRFPESYQIHRTLGLKLAEGAEAPGAAPATAEEAVTHLEIAARVDPARFADSWLVLARMHDRLGRPEKAMEASRTAWPYLTSAEQAEAAELTWRLAVAQGNAEAGLEAWQKIWPQHVDDAAAQLAAGRFLRATGSADEARERLRRAIELEPQGPSGEAARGELREMTAQAIASGSVDDPSALLDYWRDNLAEADDALLPELLALARKELRPEVAGVLAAEMLRRDPASGPAHLVMAERSLGEEDVAAARQHAESALAGSLPAADVPRARAIAGRALAREAWLTHAAGDPSSASQRQATLGRYRQALEHLNAAAGEDVASEVASVQQAITALQSATTTSVAAPPPREDDCTKLGQLARYGYETDKPVTRQAKSAVGLSRSAGESGSLATLPAGSDVSVLGTSWTGGTCWIQVKAADGTSGWARSDAFRAARSPS